MKNVPQEVLARALWGGGRIPCGRRKKRTFSLSHTRAQTDSFHFVLLYAFGLNSRRGTSVLLAPAAPNWHMEGRNTRRARKVSSSPVSKRME